MLRKEYNTIGMFLMTVLTQFTFVGLCVIICILPRRSRIQYAASNRQPYFRMELMLNGLYAYPIHHYDPENIMASYTFKELDDLINESADKIFFLNIFKVC